MAKVKVRRKRKEKEDFDISYVSRLDDETQLVSSFNPKKQINRKVNEALLSAFLEYDPGNRIFSAYTSDKSADTSNLTLKRIEELADNPQTNLTSILEINDYIRNFINRNDLIGRTFEAIETNVNTEYRLSYDEDAVEGKKKKRNTLLKAKSIIDVLNSQIGIESLIRNEIPLAYAEGTRVLYLKNVGEGYVVDQYPLGIAIVSDYTINGKPAVYIDTKELENRLKKTYLKTKGGKALFFEDVESEIKENYPPEVYEAYKKKENYALLDNSRTGIIRVGNLGRKYGLSPIFRALKPTLMLEQFEESDNINSKARAKKIIFQKMRKESMGKEYDQKAWEDMAYAHKNFIKAWKQNTVFVTGIPQVEDIYYVEPKSELTDINTIDAYRNRIMVTLGVSFLDTDGTSVSSANITISQLLLTINKISEQLESVLREWYMLVLSEQGIGYEYAPKIDIIDSEQLSMDIKKSLVELQFSKLNCSYETAFETLGMDISTEKARREAENEAGLEEIFSPHASQYTTSGDSGIPGRPMEKNPDNPNKQDYDKTYNENNR